MRRGIRRGRVARAATAAVLAACVGVGMGLAAPTARALPVALQDDNAAVEIDPTADAAVRGWSVAGVTHLREQRLFYRIGPSGPEQPLSGLSLAASAVTDTDADGQDDTLFARLVHALFSLELRWSLDGGPLGSPTTGVGADLSLQLTLTNTGAAPLDVHLFQYSDVDLFNTYADDLLELSPAGGVNTARVVDTSGLALYEAVFTPPAGAVEAALFGTSLAHLTDASPSALSGALAAGGPGGGDVTWTVEWAALLASGGALVLSQDQRIAVAPIPEPAAAALLGLGLAGLAATRRRRAARREGAR